MAKSVQLQLRDIFKRLNSVVKEAANPKSLDTLAKFTIEIIVKRTRLGYGVDRNYGSKRKLKPLSANYVKRRGRTSLFDLTSPKKSNLTLTGQMLNSMAIVGRQGNKIKIGPTGRRQGESVTNPQVAAYQEDQGRVFNRVSELEFKQMLRFYRRTFGDLLKRKKLIS